MTGKLSKLTLSVVMLMALTVMAFLKPQPAKAASQRDSGSANSASEVLDDQEDETSVTETPDPSETPEVTETPEPTEVDQNNQGEDNNDQGENLNDQEDNNSVTETPEPTDAPEPTQQPEKDGNDNGMLILPASGWVAL